MQTQLQNTGQTRTNLCQTWEKHTIYISNIEIIYESHRLRRYGSGRGLRARAGRGGRRGLLFKLGLKLLGLALRLVLLLPRVVVIVLILLFMSFTSAA